jgi:hypothetical protein|tara:strand:+ start:2602 stop:2880 length:279 start_codon:yes stop_codon:yes gene_type:complete
MKLLVPDVSSIPLGEAPSDTPLQYLSLACHIGKSITVRTLKPPASILRQRKTRTVSLDFPFSSPDVYDAGEQGASEEILRCATLRSTSVNTI